MQAAAKLKYLTPEEYLTIERQAEFKSEYVDGAMYSMAGGSPEHSLVGMNVSGELYVQLKKSSCRVFNSDQRVRVPSKRKYLYPDVTVVCDQPRFADDEKDVLLNPLLIVEVLSDSTEKYDRRKKFLYYQEIESFREYLLVDQNSPLIQHFVKQPDGGWLCTRIEGLDKTITFSTVNCTIALSDIYAKVLD